MLEVLYDTGTREVHAWCGDPEQHGNFKPKDGQTVAVLPINVADIPQGSDYVVDLDAETVYPRTPHVESPDYKAQWRAAQTPAAKLKILGERMGWEK